VVINTCPEKNQCNEKAGIMPSTHREEEQESPAIALVLGVLFFILKVAFLLSII